MGRSTSCLVREKSSLPPESNIEVDDVIDAKGSETPSEERLSRELTAGCEVSASRSGAAAACEYGTTLPMVSAFKDLAAVPVCLPLVLAEKML